MFFNTDISGYLQEKISNGFPPSSVKTREFIPNNNIYRDNIIQYPGLYSSYYLNEKRKLLEQNWDKFHQDKMSEEFRNKADKFIQDKFSTNLNIIEFCLKIPCDLIVCSLNGSESKIELCHLVFPNGWSAQDAIGKPFSFFHEEVKDTNERNVVPSSCKFVEHLVNSGKCYERVGAFSIRTHKELNRHPSRALELPNDFKHPPYFCRFERQVIMSAPELNSFLFFIHSNIVNMRSNPDLFINAIEKADKDCYLRTTLEDHGEDILKYLKKV